jgi:hypothetical protein
MLARKRKKIKLLNLNKKALFLKMEGTKGKAAVVTLITEEITIVTTMIVTTMIEITTIIQRENIHKAKKKPKMK